MPKATIAKSATSAKPRTAKTKRSTADVPASKPATKLEALIAALKAPSGATIPEMMELTGWQAHSVRGALSGALKKQRALSITSSAKNGERTYRIGGRS